MTSSASTAPPGAFSFSKRLLLMFAFCCVARRRDALRERGLGRVLPVRVDRERDVVADGARLDVERVADRCTGRVDLDRLAARLPAQLLLERALGAVLADRVALLVARRRAGVASCASEISPTYPSTCAASSPCG